MPKAMDLTGYKFGLLTVVEFIEVRRHNRYWLCECLCGNITAVSIGNLRCGRTNSCGCLKVAHVLYNTWNSMKYRCCNPNARAYKYYGGRGISVCEAWLKFENFLADMGARPTPKHQLDRIDTNGNYAPSNCRWATAKENSRNTRISKWWWIDGTRYDSIADAATELDVNLWDVLRWCNGHKVGHYTYPPKENCWSELKYPD